MSVVNAASGPVIGIDLGTTNSAIGVYSQGKVQLIPNEAGKLTTPSYVSMTLGNSFVGDAARENADEAPLSTIFGAKRLIGRKFDDPCVACDMKSWPFKVGRTENNLPAFEIDRGDGKVTSYLPEEISAMVLAQLKGTAEKSLGTSVSDAVITVPAYFNQSQREATKQAAVMAGLNVVRTINEPTAAAIAYGLDRKIGQSHPQCILVFDLGGGTLDVCLLTIHKGKVEIQATSGDSHLGGCDFDTRLVNFFVKTFKTQYGKDLSNDVRAMRRLNQAAENTKRKLSEVEETTVNIARLGPGIDFHVSVTRKDFEDMCEDLFRVTLAPVEQVLRMTNHDKCHIEAVVLVGGSTRIPKIKSLLADYLHCGTNKFNTGINPDEVVAYGAAVYAALLDPAANIQSMKEIHVEDVTNKDFSASGDVLIKRGTKLPASCTKIIGKTSEDDSEVALKVTEDDADASTEYQYKACRVPKHVPEITVTYNVDLDGLLNVTAQDSDGADLAVQCIPHTRRPRRRSRTSSGSRIRSRSPSPSRLTTPPADLGQCYLP